MLILTVENMLPIVVALGQFVLISIRFLDLELMLLSLKLAKLLLLLVLVRHRDIRQKTVLPTVARGYVYAAWLLTPFRLWNDIGICNYRKVICTSGVRLPSWILDTRWYTTMIVLVWRKQLQQRTRLIVRSQWAKQWKLSTQTCPRMSKVAHGRDLGKSKWCRVVSWSVVVISLLRGVYILWWLCTRIYWDIWLGKTAVNVWTNVRA